MDALIVARADPLSQNCSGHEASVLMPMANDKDSEVSAAMTKQQQQLDELLLAGGGGCTAEHEPFYCIRTASVHQFEQQSFLARTMGMLKPPVRDNIGFVRKAGNKALSVLGQEACSLGVWTDWITNYTHAGLAVALDALQPPEHSPTHPQKSRQAAVLTHETLFLLNGATWSVVEAIPLNDIMEITVSVYSETLLILRVRRRQDMLLDLVSRQRLLDELALAISEAAQCAHRDRRRQQDLGVIVTSTPHPLVPLLDEGHARIGTLAYVEPEVFLLLAFAPASLLLAGSPTVAFGFLEMRQRTQPRAPGAGVHWRWRRHFFILKGGGKTEGRLLWCHHPNAQQAIDWTPVNGMLKVKGADASVGEHCLVLEHAPSRSSDPPLSLTLRAKTPSICQDWITAIKALQAGALP